MFYEYAVDPASLSNWDRVRYFLDAFGPWKGRFLAEYPRRWKKMVYAGLRCPDVERSRIEVRLASLDSRVFSPRANAPYDGNRQWFENAVAEHARVPFRAVISADGKGQGVLDANAIDDRSDLWRVESGHLVPREAAVFVGMLELLLRASKRVVLIDPYFRADHSAKTQPLIAICRALVGTSAQVEVHFSDDVRGYTPCMKDASRALPTILPQGATVTLRGWKERKQRGPRLHNRYLLTDVGGVKFGDGIETGDRGQEDHVSILDEPSRARLWEQYAGNSPDFDSAGPPREFVGNPNRS